MATGWRADVVATAKRDLKSGEMLDGEGGYTVVGRADAARIRAQRLEALPLGLRTGKVPPDAAGRQGPGATWGDVAVDAGTAAYRLRREMETTLKPLSGGLAPPAVGDAGTP